MIDHIGFPVSDYPRSKAFYERALAPLGYTLIMEVGADHTDSGSPAAGFGKQGKPDFWIGGEGGLKATLHVAIAADDRGTVDAFYRAALTAGGRTRAGVASSITRTTTAPLWSIPMATMRRGVPRTGMTRGPGAPRQPRRYPEVSTWPAAVEHRSCLGDYRDGGIAMLTTSFPVACARPVEARPNATPVSSGSSPIPQPQGARSGRARCRLVFIDAKAKAYLSITSAPR
jgi:catechol 2,3-dioxygenase-like lactoylglutathione lyase family enzyme